MKYGSKITEHRVCKDLINWKTNWTSMRLNRAKSYPIWKKLHLINEASVGLGYRLEQLLRFPSSKLPACIRNSIDAR